MVAAGEAAGDLPGGLERASEVILSRLKLRDQMFSVLAYPAFVLVSAIAAVFVILLFIVPSIAPLAAELGAAPPALSVMMAASEFLRANAAMLALGAATSVMVLLGAGRAGLLTGVMERLLLDGPARRTVAGLAFGGFALSLGTMISAGAPVDEALRLAIRTLQLSGAKRRLEPVAQAVRQGEFLSSALAEVRSFPGSIVRLTAAGEASNSLGPVLVRGGRLEEESALRRIETVGRIAGPALILIMGAMLGVLMGGLLSGSTRWASRRSNSQSSSQDVGGPRDVETNGLHHDPERVRRVRGDGGERGRHAGFGRGLFVEPCQQCGPLPPGAPTPSLVDQIDLNGDKLDDWIVDAGRYPCPGRPALAASAGAQVTVFKGVAGGIAVPALQRATFGSRLQRPAEGPPTLWLTLGGADCGSTKAEDRCERAVAWLAKDARFAVQTPVPAKAAGR